MPHRGQQSFLKKLLHSWYISLDLFEPKELGVMVFASLNSMLRSSGVLLRDFSWWLFVWTAYIDLYIDGSGLFCRLWEYTTPLYYSVGFEPRLYLSSLMVSAFVILLNVRSSIEAKTLGYFVRYSSRLPFFALLFFCVPQIYAVPVFWLAAFFFFDATLGFRSFGRSLYNGAVLNLLYAPYLLCVGALHGIFFHVHRLLWELTPLEEYYFAPYATKYTTSLLLYLFFVTMLHTFYVRVVQANSTNQSFWR